jgi:5-deoxy-glucuronate isomerase
VSKTDLSRAGVVFRRTNARKGRHISVTPANSATKHLTYGRIMLDSEVPLAAFDTGGDEVGLVCFSGTATVSVAGQAFPMTRYDAIYIPRGEHVEVSTSATVDFAELRAPVDNRYPLQFVAYADVKANPGLHFKAALRPRER